VNFVAPGRVTNQEFTHALAAAVGRRAYLRVPAFAARLAPGHLADEMLLGGANAIPRRLLDSGYQFRWPELKGALRAML
jgi:NAD dependent epimerase/dehydratase family enzyme